MFRQFIFGDHGLFSDDFIGEYDAYVQTFQVYPVSFVGKEDLEKGNKIILPPSSLEKLARLNISYPILFQISSEETKRFSHCGVLEFIAEEGTAYIPYWMMQNLRVKEGDFISVKNVSLVKGTFTKLQPFTSDFLDISNPRVVLENSLCHFATLTEGEEISISYNEKNYKIHVVETRPENAISIIETDVQVEFEAPKDYVPPVPPKPEKKIDVNELLEKYELPGFRKQGQRLDGKPTKEVTVEDLLMKRKLKELDDDELFGEKPWLKKLVNGVKTSPPYGYEGNK